MLRRSVIFAVMLAMTPALAADYLSGDKLFETVAGKTFVWPDKTSSTYGRDGLYRFDGTATKLQGTWQVQGDKVCVTFESGVQSCYKYLYSGSQLNLQDASGKRFLAREVSRPPE
jgi:hypothetical protein